MINDAVIVQQRYASHFGSLKIPDAAYNNMMRMTYLRHSAYAIAHQMDFYSILGDYSPDMLSEAGAWAKVALIDDLLKKGYKYVFWIDVDAAIVDFETDLRDAVKDCDWGACEHDPMKSKWLADLKIDKHINVGVMYVKSSKKSKAFVKAWRDAYPGPPRWADQGAFNQLLKDMPDVVKVIDDKWNSTVRVSEVPKPVVMGWHGIPVNERYSMMYERFKDDALIYRI
jgi:hypothetical protein